MAWTLDYKNDDTIDSREIIERIEELESREDYDPIEDGEDALSSEEAEELRKLRVFAEEASGYAVDWYYGETLIHDSYFTRYCEELVAELYDLEDVPDFIRDNIDWEGVADDLKADYTSVELDGETYWIR